jgi:hypothetical protein
MFVQNVRPHELGRFVSRPEMSDWTAYVVTFSAGVAAGVLLRSIVPILRAKERRRTALVAARERILANLKEQHDKEILHAALQTTEDIRGELNKSLQTLRKTVTTLLEPGIEQPSEQGKPAPSKSN